MSTQKHVVPENFKIWLEGELKRRGWSYRRLAREAREGASHTATNLILSGERALTWDYCAAIARAFKISPIRVFLEAELLGPDDLPFPVRLLESPSFANHRVSFEQLSILEN